MRKYLFISAMAFSFCQPAWAQDFKPYIGFDAQRTVYNYNDNYDIGGGFALDGDTVLEDGLNGLNVHVGNRFHNNFGVELGYFRTKEESKSIAVGTTVGPGTVAAAPFRTKVKTQGIALDGLGYLPVHDQVDLIGTAGITWTKAEIEAVAPGAGDGSVDESEFGFRLGGGAQAALTDAVNLRGLVRYQKADFDDVADRAWTYSLGLNYSF